MMDQKLENEVFIALLNSLRTTKETESRQRLGKSLQCSLEIMINEKNLHPTIYTVNIEDDRHHRYNIVKDKNDGIYYLQCKCDPNKIFFPNKDIQALREELLYLESNI